MDIRSENRRRKFTVSATSGVLGAMAGSVMQLAFLSAMPGAWKQNASQSGKAWFGPKRDLVQAAEPDRPAWPIAVFQIGGGKNRALRRIARSLVAASRQPAGLGGRRRGDMPPATSRLCCKLSAGLQQYRHKKPNFGGTPCQLPRAASR